MRIALGIAIAFSIASGAGTYAYLDARTVDDRTLGHPARSEWGDRARMAQHGEISLPFEAPR
jgi:hypothetical protein